MGNQLDDNNVIDQKEIFRLAASLYADLSDSYSSSDTQLQMIKLAFVEKENNPMTHNEIAAIILDMFKYHISSDEILSIVFRYKKDFHIINSNGNNNYCLTKESFSRIANIENKTIDYYIKLFSDEKSLDFPICTDTIHRYLYELTTTNITSYNILLSGNKGNTFTDDQLSVNTEIFSDQEIILIRDFLSWENEEKNIALGNIVFCCLEYCLLVSGDSPNQLLKDVIRQREVYLDTNIIFRAIGTDGIARKKVVLAFLKKCKQAKLTLIILSQTKSEFEEAIDYYISQLLKYQRGSIYLGAYEQLSGYTFFSFYQNWLEDHKDQSLKGFRLYIKSAYANLISTYNIIDAERIPDKIFNTDDFKNTRNNYSRLISESKKNTRRFYDDSYYGYSKTDSHDASAIRYIELKRVTDTGNKDIFFVSSDKALRYWDMTRNNNNIPVVIYPSQLFLILIKICGRAENDFDSFVSFINIRPRSQQITPEKANIILSGISTITEDITTQKLLVSTVYDDEFQDIIRHSNTDLELYEKAKEYSQKYLEEELKTRDNEILRKTQKITQLTATQSEQKENIEKLSQKISDDLETINKRDEIIHEKEGEIEKKNNQIYILAEKHIKPKFLLKTYILPIFLIIILFVFISFISFQFLFTDKEWNPVIRFYKWTSKTFFGKTVEDYVYVIDTTLGGGIIFLLKKLFKNPFDKTRKLKEKEEMINSYISNLTH